MWRRRSRTDRAPEPFFIRTATNDAIEFWHTNLVPNYYELDDFQVRTPTDVIGQHIHLVKFDVTSSDGGANGFNYEDGTFGPDEVRDRIDAISNVGGLYRVRSAHRLRRTRQSRRLSPSGTSSMPIPKRTRPAMTIGLFGEPPAARTGTVP